MWVIGRAIDRLAARWPRQVQIERLREEAAEVLREVAMTAESPEEVVPVATEQVAHRLCDLLAGSEWYRHAVVGRARPLCDAWTGALLAGREPTDHLLRSWLRLDDTSLSDRFMEMALVFAIEPAALLRPDADLHSHLEAALTNLPPEQQIATSLYFQEDITFAEIARVMNVRPEQAQTLLGRASTAVVGETALATWPGRRLTA